MKKVLICSSILFLSFSSCSVNQSLKQSIAQPEKFGAVPTQRQLDWQKLEYYGFVHFNMNTFTDREWGYGDEKPEWFNPTDFDAEQWVKVAKKAGMKGLILTAKHHDGFCLWPSAYTEHTIANSPYKNGKGDIVKELAEACKKHDLLFGVYLSPWDRNHAAYAQDAYVDVFLGQLNELLTNYGDLFEVWFDGANGGDGYYGGAREARKIDAKTYYRWGKVVDMVREHQPKAVIFGAKGADIRWIGNEEGIGTETNWSTMNPIVMNETREQLQKGVKNAEDWLPAEADVSVRPGWYYHAREDHLVRPLSHMVDIYYKSVGRNANLLLNIPVDTRGLVHENDEQRLYELYEVIQADFENKVSEDAEFKADGRTIESKFMTDDELSTYYYNPQLEDSQQQVIEIDLGKSQIFNRLQVQENIEFGQRVESFELEIFKDNQWHKITEGTTIGYQRLLRFEPVKAQKARLIIKKSLAAPVISTFNLYKAPNLLVEPTLERKKSGEVSFSVPNKQTEIYYSYKKDQPQNFTKFSKPLKISEPTTIYYASFDPETQKYSSVQTANLDIPKAKWQAIDENGKPLKEATKAIDENVYSVYVSTPEAPEIIIDLGENIDITGFTYWPSQERWAYGTIQNYELYTSEDLKSWNLAKEGEFSNVKNNPIEQKILFQKTNTRYIKLKSTKTTDGSKKASFAEVSVITLNP